MAKVKNKRNAGLADKVHNKKRAEANKKKLNPFEVHINKEKLKVLGKKSKHDRGLPGVSRAKAIQKRKETLGTEMKLINKTNTFIDRRIGEKNNQISAEDRMIARFAAERAKQHSKKNIYNLADDEVLTHRGQTLEQIEKFDDPRSSDDEDEGAKFGGLGDDFVAEGHFGGGVLSKSDSKDGAKSHKDLIEQLIAESKKRKAEKQKEKEQTLDLTEKLDSEWKDLQPVVFKKQKVEEESLIDKLLSKQEKGQDYDKMMRELRFEKRGTPSDGLKNQEKQNEEERKKIEELERQRELRMLSEEEQIAPKNKQPAKHRSADDLDDNFELDTEQNFMLAYDKDGKPLVPDHVLKDFSVPNSKKTFEDGVSDTSDEESENESGEEGEESAESENDQEESEENKEVNKTKDSDSDEDSSDDSEEIKSNKEDILKQKSAKEDKDDSDSDEDDEGDESDESEQSDSNKKTSDKEINKKIAAKVTSNVSKETKNLKRKLNSESVEEVKPKTDKKENKIQTKSEDNKKLNDSKNDEAVTDDDSSDDESVVSGDKSNDVPNVDDLNDLKGSDESEPEVEDSSEMIGSFFEFKSDEGDNLKELLKGKTPVQQSAALKKLIKSYDPGLSQDNKEKLSRLFAHLLQYIHDIFTNLTNEGEIVKSVLIFDRLVPYLYDLVHINKVSTKKFMVELLKEKYDSYKRNPRKVPDLNTIIFFKLVSILYPTSDFRHPVATPSLIFMNDILTLARFKDAYSLSRGFFIMSLLLEYTVLSKRLVPAALNFLRGILYLCVNTREYSHFRVVPPFRSKNERILNLELRCSEAVEKKLTAQDLAATDIDDSFKIRCFSTAVEMLRELFDNYIELETLRAIFEPHVDLLSHIDWDFYPKRVCDRAEEIYKYMRESLEVMTYRQMCREKERPKALRLYEPDIQEVFTGSRNSKLSKENAEKARLKGKYKKEMKGALREIRRDKAYVASVKIRQRIQSDNVRKEKVKQIYKDASIQQGELNKFKRMK